MRRIALLSAMFLFFYVSNAKALENFNLNSITASDIGRFDGHSPRHGTRHSLGRFDGHSPRHGTRHSLGRFDGHSPRHGTRHSLEFSDDLSQKSVFGWIKPKQPKEWTIMVFINAKNDLEKYGLKDVNEMEMVGSSDKVNIVVELGRMDGFAFSEGDWKGSRRYLIQKDNNINAITSPVVQDLGKADMGDWNHLVDFGKWAKTKYPAKKYMLIVWNHGSGWEKSIESMASKGLSYDDETGNHFTTPELGKALNNIGKLDVYSSEACLMQMASVGYEIKDNISYIVGSEETEPADGYAYNMMLEPMVSNPAITPYEAAKVLVDAYANHYQELGIAHTQSFIITSALPKLLQLMNDWTDAVIESDSLKIVRSVVSSAQRYDMRANKDLYNFISLVTEKTSNADIKEKGEILMNHIKENVVGHNRRNNLSGDRSDSPKDYSDSHGMAIYLPGYSYDKNYDELKWAKDSNWDEFIKWYIKDIFSGVWW